MAGHFFGNGTVTLVWLSTACDGRLVPTKKARVSGPADVRKLFPLTREDDTPIVGPRVFREMTNAELKALGLDPSLKKKDSTYWRCLVNAVTGDRVEEQLTAKKSGEETVAAAA